VIRSQLTDDSPASDQIRPQVDASMALLGQTAERIRDVMADLRPPVLDDYGLVAALDWYGSQFVAPRGITVTMGGQEPSPRLAPQVELALFRIAQEALTNVIKHAQATKATVHLETDPDQDTVRLVVVDDGTGFDPARQAGPADRQSWGLIGMVERAEAVGAHCRIESASGQGTQVVVEVTR
jgi:two-component system sensor histidine kinase UhpB